MDKSLRSVDYYILETLYQWEEVLSYSGLREDVRFDSFANIDFTFFVVLNKFKHEEVRDCFSFDLYDPSETSSRAFVKSQLLKKRIARLEKDGLLAPDRLYRFIPKLTDVGLECLEDAKQSVEANLEFFEESLKGQFSFFLEENLGDIVTIGYDALARKALGIFWTVLLEDVGLYGGLHNVKYDQALRAKAEKRAMMYNDQVSRTIKFSA